MTRPVHSGYEPIEKGTEMRIIVVCDGDGAIMALMTRPEGGLRPSVPNLPLNHQEIEMDMPGISDDSDDAEIQTRLNDLITRHRVDVSRKEFVPR
jgi:hypothetical protein